MSPYSYGIKNILNDNNSCRSDSSILDSNQFTNLGLQELFLEQSLQVYKTDKQI